MGTLTQNTEARKRARARRVRGWRIRIYRGIGAGTELPIIWASSVPEQWAQVQQDSTVIRAIMFRSGKQFQQWSRSN